MSFDTSCLDVLRRPPQRSFIKLLINNSGPGSHPDVPKHRRCLVPLATALPGYSGTVTDIKNINTLPRCQADYALNIKINLWKAAIPIATALSIGLTDQPSRHPTHEVALLRNPLPRCQADRDHDNIKNRNRANCHLQCTATETKFA